LHVVSSDEHEVTRTVLKTALEVALESLRADHVALLEVTEEFVQVREAVGALTGEPVQPSKRAYALAERESGSEGALPPLLDLLGVGDRIAARAEGAEAASLVLEALYRSPLGSEAREAALSEADRMARLVSALLRTESSHVEAMDGEGLIAGLRAIAEAMVSVAAEPSLDALLEHLARSAASITGAKYAAVGILDRTGSWLDAFITHGVDEETRRRIGPPPMGRGLLGALIKSPSSLRLRDLKEDPRSVGFPPGHPPMTSFLGVPIMLRAVPYGNLYVTDKITGAEFTEADEHVATLLAAGAAVAIENLRLYEATRDGLRQSQALAEIERDLSSDLEPQRLFELMAAKTRDLVRARIVIVSSLHGDGSMVVRAAAGEGAHELIGARIPDDKLRRLLVRGTTDRIDELLEDAETDREEISFVARATGRAPRAAIHVPVGASRGYVTGSALVSVYDKRDAASPAFSEADLRVVERLTGRGAIALELSQRVSRETLAQLEERSEQERAELARNLHDQAAQALTALRLSLGGIRRAETPEEISERVREAEELVADVIGDLREIAVRLRPAALDDFGIGAALEHLVKTLGDRSTASVEVHVSEFARLKAELETVIYRVAQEALVNALRHADATQIEVRLEREGDQVRLLVRDDGVGFDPGAPTSRLGLAGMRERVERVQGAIEVLSARGLGTTIIATVPFATAQGADG
jgi:signal transduction histidine kinase